MPITPRQIAETIVNDVANRKIADEAATPIILERITEAIEAAEKRGAAASGILSAALLWLLNHYEFDDPERQKLLRKAVIARVQLILKESGPSMADMAALKKLYPDEIPK